MRALVTVSAVAAVMSMLVAWGSVAASARTGRSYRRAEASCRTAEANYSRAMTAVGANPDLAAADAQAAQMLGELRAYEQLYGPEEALTYAEGQLRLLLYRPVARHLLGAAPGGGAPEHEDGPPAPE